MVVSGGLIQSFAPQKGGRDHVKRDCTEGEEKEAFELCSRASSDSR